LKSPSPHEIAKETIITTQVSAVEIMPFPLNVNSSHLNHNEISNLGSISEHQISITSCPVDRIDLPISQPISAGETSQTFADLYSHNPYAEPVILSKNSFSSFMEEKSRKKHIQAEPFQVKKANQAPSKVSQELQRASIEFSSSFDNLLKDWSQKTADAHLYSSSESLKITAKPSVDNPALI
jgi:hypothetical protein